MKAAPFAYVRAAGVGEAVAALSEGALVLAGGQSLVPLLNMRLVRPHTVMDVNRLDLAHLHRSGADLVLGALTRHRQVETSPLVRRDVPLLAAAMSHVGYVAVRNRGTTGGSIAHADPAAELPAVCVALDASFTVQGARGRREIPAGEFFLGPHRTALAADELLVETRVPVPPVGSGHGVAELSRRANDLAVVAVVACVAVSEGTVTYARIAVAGAAPTPIRATVAESVLLGRTPSADVIASAADAVADATDPSDDLRAPAAYRREMAVVLTRRALRQAVTS
ncbi:carbon-monoxide dehydrogenase medium subunit [Saccharothrix tamanrassetensis]|uniref:Carbon-monoxide dehydrogenase medium subunit n=1 Tax=Saccharothrix tamanrassetensis TaxID=1051531 RepID=A0A841CQ81_9PSEU|nr:FAD binding domain-containing protein [Saccharothrix tamanrassetensis]MBB5958288.1 carbon-monoxide dehydrogenase medium subunit [Saccharothrix tamanrassetensis]